MKSPKDRSDDHPERVTKRRISVERMRELLAEARAEPKAPTAKQVARPKPVPPPMTDEEALEALIALMDTPVRQKTFGRLVRPKIAAAGISSQAEASRRLGYANRGMFNNALDGRFPSWSKVGWEAERLKALLTLTSWNVHDALRELRLALG